MAEADQPSDAPPPVSAEREPDEFVGSRDLTSWPTRVGRRLDAAGTGLATRARAWLDHSTVPYLVLFVTIAIGVIGAAIFTAASAEIYDQVGDRDGVAGLDQPVLDQMIRWRTPTGNSLVTDFTHLGGGAVMPVIATVAALLLSWWWRKWTPALLMGIAATGSLLLTVVGKQVVGRVRPDTALAVPPYETSPSFPSGHSINSWVILLLIAYLVVTKVDSRLSRILTIAAALLLSVAMGLSRVYLGHHWLTDVLVAWTLGSAWLLVVITGHRLALTVRRRTTD